MRTKQKRLGEMLIEAGLITEIQLRGALGRQMKWGGRLGGNLIKLGNLSEQNLLRFLAAQTGIKEIDISKIRILPHITKLVPEKVADKHTLIPLAMKDQHTLIVACADPTDLAALDHISFITSHKVIPVIATQTQILAAIDRYYRGGVSRHGDMSQVDDMDMTVELSPPATGDGNSPHQDPELILFDHQSKHKPKVPVDQGAFNQPKQGQYRQGPPPNLPDPFQRAAPPAPKAANDEFTLDFNPDWAAPAATKTPQRPQARQKPFTAGQKFSFEQKTRAFYNVLIRKGLITEAEIQQELMRLWSKGKL